MDSIKDERKLLLLTYLLCMAMFLNLGFLKDPFDTGALIMGGVLCILIGYAYFIIRRFFNEGDKFMLIFACLLSVIGIAMLYRLKSVDAIKQTVWFAISITTYILVVVLLPDLKTFSKYKKIYMVGTLIFMSMATFIGTEVYGAKNWVFIGPISFQPSEAGKLFLAAYLASSLKDYKTFKDLIEPAIVVIVSLAFMVYQKDLGSVLIFFGISITMLYMATSKVKYIVTAFGLSIIGSLASYKMFPHVRKRIMIWQDPWKYASDESFQIIQGLFAISSGGLFGSGFGLGLPGLVPVRTTDFIFAVICEELGVIMGFGIIILYFLLFYRCMRTAIYVDDKFSQLITVGYSAVIASQALVIIGGVMNVIPLTGITLPFVSYGGSSILTMFFALAIIQKVSEEG
ncbi:FtsW/RodA/SpoVE family cell cycle protein [Clostridium algidicarnis]|uniref:FtsW/RodA/SpoVE family cell cycle protein n=1 Tax=Clostridium algidicarnis TaxID=37659 RepID=UPI001C0D0321|nr:FtsW/RodA/SpoVE family cell cycle protein [Clostridium algidicarnis]MBU3196237.1 FtsW/RodA/SpoVE family cell cycle protein [Clostridium algidicarnis]